MTAHSPEEIARQIALLDREQLVHEILHFDGRFPLDFTGDYLHRQSDDQLRHILFNVAFQDLFSPRSAH